METKNENKPIYDGSELGETKQRVNVQIINETKNAITCKGVLCQGLLNPKTGALWADGDVLEAGASAYMQSQSCDRIFAQFESNIKGVPTAIMFQIAVTVPDSSNNSAAGYFGNEGLQWYKATGTPGNFLFKLGEINLASWTDDKHQGTTPPTYGDC